MSPVVEVVRTYLELRTRDQLRPAYVDDARVRFVRRDDITAPEYRTLYRAVGEQWHWRDREPWPDEKLAAYLARPSVRVWECRVDDASAGYFELERDDDGAVEIAYFGLVPAFTGRGLGKAMLTRAAEEAFAFGANRVWLHTCTLDGPHALSNYTARGFEETRKERYVRQI